MYELTIKPFDQFFAANPTRTHFRRGDLQQLENKISNLIAQKEKVPAQRKSIFINQKHLEIVRQVQAHFTARPKLSRAELQELVTQILRAENLEYTSEWHPLAHGNCFEPASRAPTRAYDVAFYNWHGRYRGTVPSPEGGHHYSESDQSSIFYARCERFGDNMLIGNMQIDEPNHYRWRNQGPGKLLSAGKNLAENLIRHSILHALDRGAKNIMFQCGDAVNLAQGFRAKVEILTPDNLPKFERRYHAALRQFEKIAPGDTSTLDRANHYNDLVINKTPAAYETYELHCYANTRRPRESFLAWAVLHSLPTERFRELDRELWGATDNFIDGRAEKALSWINAVFAAAGVKPARRGEARAEKIEFLRRRLKGPRESENAKERSFFAAVESFAYKYKYAQDCLAHNHHLKKIRLTEKTHLAAKYCYVNLRKRSLRHTFKRKYIVPPAPGKIYTRSQQVGDEDFPFLWNKPPRDKNSLYGVLKWYDQYLPTTLKKFGLDIERCALANTRKQVAHVWVLKAGVEEFKAKAVPLFAARETLKTDYVTLPQLETAAEKFGLTPAQLHVANDWLTIREQGRHAGRYDPDTDRMALATPSLALLAHEGTHRLLTREILPPAEREILIKAGQRWAEQTPTATQLLTQKDAAGNFFYPPGPTRAQEAAALFVEHYYDYNVAARKFLMGGTS